MEKGIAKINIEEEMRTSFLDYSMSVIVSRALPDVRDGLKPVHRRILYSMHENRQVHSRAYVKSARVVGDVIGRFHPHGDSAVYDALVRLAQSFSMSYPLIDGQGNFGSVDGDAAAAMRYTECRLHELASYLLLDIERETVAFGPNYDNKEFEPLVLPTRVPNLLVNGATGIAVGMATNVPPHNLFEITTAVDAFIDNPQITVRELMRIVQGPDFPTGALIVGNRGIYEAYETGRGMIMMRGRTLVEEVPGSTGRFQIVVTAIPYQVNKAKLIEKIAELVREKKLEGISDLRDESAQEEMRIVIELKRSEVPDVVLNNLFKMTPLQSTFGVNAVALVRGMPRTLSLREMLEQFYLHRREVITKRTIFELRKAEERCHIIEGLKTAVENIDAIVALIRGAADTQAAHEGLCSRFNLSDPQAKAILEMRLSRLTGLEIKKLLEEYEQVRGVIKDLRDILENPGRITQIVRLELQELRDKFPSPRRTEIIASEADEFSMKELVADEEVVVTITHSGYVKRTLLTEFKTQKRGGRGKSGMLTKDEDVVRDLYLASNHMSLLCFSNFGRVYELKVYELPEAALRSRGKHFVNLIRLEQENERIVSVLPVREFVEQHFVVCVTVHGYIKKTELTAFANIRATGIIGLKLDEGDALIACAISGGKSDLVISSKLGKAIRFNEEQARPMGRSARGVRAMDLGEGDAVIGMEVLRSNSTLLSVCVNGYGKRTGIDEYRIQSRGGKGIFTIKVSDRNGPVVAIVQVEETDDILIMTSDSKVIRMTVADLAIIGRLTQGVRLVALPEGEKVIGVCKISPLEIELEDEPTPPPPPTES